MTELQLHVDPLVNGAHLVRIYDVRRVAGEPSTAVTNVELIQQRPVGYLELPPWLVQQLVQYTPLVERMAGPDVRMVWTGEVPQAATPDPLLAKLGKVLRAMRRVFGPRS